MSVETLTIIALCVTALTLVVFFLGPWVLEKFFEKADEWAEIIDSMKDDK